MSDAGRAIAVLRFRAGDLHLGIAAEDVLSVVESAADVPHIASLLGIPRDLVSHESPAAIQPNTQPITETDPLPGSRPQPESDEETSASHQERPFEQRVIQVAARGAVEPFAFAADAPVRVTLCRSHDVLPLSSRALAESWQPIMGFASLDGRTVVLLDIASVAEKLLEERGGRLS